MNSKGIVAVTDHTLCMCCLQNKATVVHKMTGRWYPSNFDGMDSYLQVCDDCDEDVYYKWFNQTRRSENYLFEDEVLDLVSELPLESQELFWNTFNDGTGHYFQYGQDWIDYELDELEGYY